MKVVILCGGMGTRLREETEYRPKPMVEIGDRPILWHIMKTYAHYGFGEFILCLGYKGWLIKEYFLNYTMMHNDFTVGLGGRSSIQFHDGQDDAGWEVTLAETGLHAMTGARVKRIQKYVDGDVFMLTYGDGIADVDLSDLLDFHNQHGRIGTVIGVSPPSKFGKLLIRDGHVARFAEKPLDGEGLINGGFFVFDSRIFDYLEDDDGCILERAPLERVAAEGELMVYTHDGFWQCMDTYRDFLYLNDLWEKQETPWKVWEHELVLAR